MVRSHRQPRHSAPTIALVILPTVACVRVGVEVVSDAHTLDAGDHLGTHEDAELGTGVDSSDVETDAGADAGTALEAGISDSGVAASDDAGVDRPRFDPDFALDPGTGPGPGTVVLAGTAPGDNYGSGIAVDEQGRIVVVGMTFNSVTDRDLALWRLLDDGTLDPSFAVQGYLRYHASPYDWGADVFISSSGKIIVAGNIDYGTDDPTLWRFNEDGGLDLSFGSNGRSRISLPGEVQGAGAALDPSVGLYLLGRQYSHWFDVSRFTGDGQLDPSFAQGAGHITFNAIPEAGGQQVIVDSVGRVVVVGSAKPDGASADSDLAVWRFTPDGRLDPSFGGGGYFLHDGAAGMPGSNDSGFDVVEIGDGRLVVAGASTNTSTRSEATLWTLSAAGELEPSFGKSGIVTDHNAAGGDGDDSARAVTLDAEGRLVVVGTSTGLGGTRSSPSGASRQTGRSTSHSTPEESSRAGLWPPRYRRRHVSTHRGAC